MVQLVNHLTPKVKIWLAALSCGGLNPTFPNNKGYLLYVLFSNTYTKYVDI
jgi:hypothetical protein